MDKYVIIGRIYKYLHMAGEKLCLLLSESLPKLSNNWWIDCVTSKLSFEQLEIIKSRDIKSLEELDLSMILRVTEKNWLGVSRHGHIDRDKKKYICAMTKVRNNWAHIPVIFPEREYILSDLNDIVDFYTGIFDDIDMANEVRQFITAMSWTIPNNVAQQDNKFMTLKKDVPYGTNAYTIYLDGCKNFNWDDSKKHSFERHSHLHAPYATPEEFSVWFVCYSNINLSETELNKRKRQNRVYKDSIVEFDKDARSAGIDPFSESPYRLVFVKTEANGIHKYGEYVYYGVFELGPITYGGNGELTREFNRNPIFDTYPVD